MLEGYKDESPDRLGSPRALPESLIVPFRHFCQTDSYLFKRQWWVFWHNEVGSGCFEVWSSVEWRIWLALAIFFVTVNPSIWVPVFCLLVVQNRLDCLGHISQASFKLCGSFQVGKMSRFQGLFIVHFAAVSPSLFVMWWKHLCLVVLNVVAWIFLSGVSKSLAEMKSQNVSRHLVIFMSNNLNVIVHHSALLLKLYRNHQYLLIIHNSKLLANTSSKYV